MVLTLKSGCKGRPLAHPVLVEVTPQLLQLSFLRVQLHRMPLREALYKQKSSNTHRMRHTPPKFSNGTRKIWKKMVGSTQIREKNKLVQPKSGKTTDFSSKNVGSTQTWKNMLVQPEIIFHLQPCPTPSPLRPPNSIWGDRRKGSVPAERRGLGSRTKRRLFGPAPG